LKELIFRIVDKNGVPVNFRNNGRKNIYFSSGHAKSAATQFNSIRVFKNGETHQIDGAPFSVVGGKVEWDE